MPDAAERELGEVTWIVDYNRQNLDGARTVNPRGIGGNDGDRMERFARANGWDVIQLRHGSKRRALFSKKSGRALQDVLENGFSDYAFQILLSTRDGSRVREAITEIDKRGAKVLAKLSDEEVFSVFEDLGGHDVEALITTMRMIRNRRANQPTLLIAHTIKGWGLDCYGAPGNHSALPDADEMQSILRSQGLSETAPFARIADDSIEGQFLSQRSSELRAGIERCMADRIENRTRHALKTPISGDIGVDLSLLPLVHTQYVWGQLAAKLVRLGTEGGAKNDLEAEWYPAAQMLVTMAPDVGTSTNINATMNDRIYGVESEPDWERDLEMSERGRPHLHLHEGANTRHLRFEIAEANSMCAVGAFGKIRDRLGIPIVPVMTVYDFFIKRALDQLYYNLYWKSGFIIIGTPSGVTLSPEGAQHSWKSDIQMPNLVTWEAFFGVEMDWILSDSVRRHYEGDDEGRQGVVIRGVTRAFKQAELQERLSQAKRFEGLSKSERLAHTRQDALRGGYYLVDYRGYDGYIPGENVVNIFSMGAMGSEAMAASDRLRTQGIFANVIVVTSADLLCGHLAHADDYAHLRKNLDVQGDLHVVGTTIQDRGDFATIAGRRVPLVAVVDGEPGLLDNLGSIVGVRCEALGVRKPSKCGRPVDAYGYLGIDADAVYEACGRVLSDTALENVVVSKALLSGAAPSPIDRDALWPPHQ